MLIKNGTLKKKKEITKTSNGKIKFYIRFWGLSQKSVGKGKIGKSWFSFSISLFKKII